MADVVDPATRSRMMAGIRGKDTTPEILVRRGLFELGFRYRLHDKRLPGKPDIVLPRYRAAVFVHGCFWHYHGCALSKLPATRRRWWKAKLERNRRKDLESVEALLEAGWRVLTIWECSFRRRRAEVGVPVIARTARWIRAGKATLELPADPKPPVTPA